MPTAELTIKHVNKNIESAPQAFSYGFAEAFGRALGWALVIGAFLHFIDFPERTENNEQTEQTE